ncbi:MAG TPA: acyloxyacyl hydrolase [Tepidisphaeraceae bacterium]|jgi:hypothetical protein|nr:acyloxyacyl hydrolase [Tepidisphaeraceae bacterium]
MRRQLFTVFVTSLLAGTLAHSTTAVAATGLSKGDFTLTTETAYVAGLGSTAIPSLLVGGHYFVSDSVSLGAMVSAAGVWQPGEDAAMFGLAGVLRHHVVRWDRATFFMDVSFGPHQASQRVPEAGTYFNFITRVGPGATVQLSDRTHLMVAARYWHLSNARIDGPERNPSMNGAEIAVGLMWKW